MNEHAADPGKKPRLRKARKRAKVAIKSGKKLIKKHGNKIDPAKTAEIQGGLDALLEASQGRDVKPIYDAIQTLDDLSELYLGQFRKSPTREYIESIGLAVGVALLLRAFVVEAFTIPSGSMVPTLAVGDFLFVNKLSYGVRLPFTNNLLTQWSVPERGDVIVFRWPCDKSFDYIKRVVGLPGDVVELRNDPEGRRQGFVRVNGELVGETHKAEFSEFRDFDPTQAQRCKTPHRYITGSAEQAYATLHCGLVEPLVPESGAAPMEWTAEQPKNRCRNPNFPGPQGRPLRFPLKVPEGHVFVMGDNRENSEDSRYWGFVPFGSIKGKAMFIWLSWDSDKPWSRPWQKIRWGRLFSGVHAAPE